MEGKRFEEIKGPKPEDFIRYIGVKEMIFDKMLKILKAFGLIYIKLINIYIFNLVPLTNISLLALLNS